jgi:hypothetical protein
MSCRKTAVLVGLPLATIVLAGFLLSWGGGFQKARAAGTDFSISTIALNDTCDSTSGPTKCAVTSGQNFTVGVNLLSQAGPWAGYELHLKYVGAISYNAGSLVLMGGGVWPGCALPTDEVAFTPGDAPFACADASGADQTFTGLLATLTFHCAAQGSGIITLVHGFGNTELSTSTGSTFENADESLTINCLQPPPVGGVSLDPVALPPSQAADPPIDLLIAVAVAATLALAGMAWYGRSRRVH